jgi:YD repeat-containing protein
VVLALVGTLLATGSTDAANGSVTYSYDALGRVTAAFYDTGVCLVYAYDANGNRLSESIVVVTGTSTGIWGCFTWNNANWGT